MNGVACPSCETVAAPGAKFCAECGTPLARPCPSCGTPADAAAKFCAECGTPLGASASTPAAAPVASTPVAERRVVTVLFADLVGFTTQSESRDAEETRELLSLYFETARNVIERYGGRVEKFIGDAVMALWGAPVAQEDDAERAVRAALELVSAVHALGVEVGAPDLHLRAGALTGEAAVTLGAEDQGMVAGDLVNSASRIQSAAEPGTVLVGDATRRSSEAAIAYEDAGTHELKGKAEPLRLWRALRVIANVGGEGRAAGLEAPFVGRDRELRLVKDLFHATADEGKPHLLSVVGVAGIGKSRLAWEFEKYLDGLVANVWWHRGRCLAYGDAIAYWALAEMVRMRALITEDEAADSAVEKLSTAIVTHVSDADERAFIEPRLQHLLGLTDRTAPDREDLFSALRLFFERMAESGPVLLLFEDLQWADTALVEFVDYLLEWSRSFPIFVITLARPELADRHANWGASTRSFTSLFLEPLATESIDEILRGLVPGLPEESLAKIRDRADGIPLYAVETVRMLLDRGVLERHGDEYRPVGAIEALDVPESLQALIAARLDGLDPEERRLLGDASVLGKTFLPRGLAALSGVSESEIQPLLASLVRKEVLVLDSDPRSPERGQFGFLQALVQRIAYETLARRDRKAKHLAAAQYLADQAGIDPDEIAEVIAAHYLDAYRAAPDDADASELRASALEWLKHAAERAAALAATDDAQRALDAASELADTPLERAALLERAGGLALAGNRPEAAEERLRTAYQLFDEAGATHDAARVAAGLGMPIWNLGRIDEAIELMENAFAVLASDEPDADVAMLTAQLGRLHYFAGNLDTARERIELALETAEELDLPGVLAGALNTKSLILQNRPHESHALLREALEIALSHDLVFDALRAYNNLLVRVILDDRRDDVGPLTEEALLLARRRGDRFWEVRFRWGLIEDLRNAGEWDRLLAEAETLPAVETADTLIGMGYCMLARVCFDRGDDQRARGWLSLIAPELDEDASDFQARGMVLVSQSLIARAEGRYDDALGLVRERIELCLIGHQVDLAVDALADAAEVAQLLGDPGAAVPLAERLSDWPRSLRTRLLESQLARIRANAAAARGDEAEAVDAYALALANARNVGEPTWLAPVLLDYGSWLVTCGREDDAAPLLAEARGIYGELGAVRMLALVKNALPAATAV